MSYSIDANVLLYAANTAAPQHEHALAFLRACAARSEPLCVAWPTLMAFLRISTHPAIFPSPLSWAEASANVAALLALPHVRAVGEAEGFWEALCAVAGPLRCAGNLIPDAHLATILQQNGVKTLYTNDADFRRFDFLELRSPFGASSP